MSLAQSEKPEPTPTPAVTAASDTQLKDSTGVEPIERHHADYPSEAREKQIQGEVRVKVFISEDGTVEKAEMVSGDPIFADAAVRAAKKWKFKPFIRNGRPIKVSTTIPFDFAFSDKIKDEPAAKTGCPLPTPKPAATPAASPVAADTTKRVRIASGVAAGFACHRVAPVYPPEAKRRGVQGTVILQAVIGKDGRVHDLKPVSGPDLLVQSAIGAVQQWLYRPYALNGEPVEVETQIQVNFQLH